MTSSTGDQLAAGLRLNIVWRDRLRALGEAGWSCLADAPPNKLQWLRNCPPAAFATDLFELSGNRACNYSSICPWCYAREVVKLFDTVKVAVEATPGPTQLTWAVGKRYEPSKLRGKPLCEALEHHRRALSKLIAANRRECIGAHSALTLDPCELKGGKKRWRLTYRILALMKTEHSFDWIPEKWRGHRYDNVDEGGILTAVSRSQRYPEGLFRGNVHRVIDALSARRLLRLSESFGAFRSHRR